VICKDVPGDTVVVGNPAREVNKVYNLRCLKGYFKGPYLWKPYKKVEGG
jgi:hypothetical protein